MMCRRGPLVRNQLLTRNLQSMELMAGHRLKKMNVSQFFRPYLKMICNIEYTNHLLSPKLEDREQGMEGQKILLY